jgi:hypothetical protein
VACEIAGPEAEDYGEPPPVANAPGSPKTNA